MHYTRNRDARKKFDTRPCNAPPPTPAYHCEQVNHAIIARTNQDVNASFEAWGGGLQEVEQSL